MDDTDKQGLSGSFEDNLRSELESILGEQRNRSIMDRERDLNMYRSGSAPPTVEGSMRAMGSVFGSSDYRDFNGNGSINSNTTSSSSSSNIGLSNNGVFSEEEFRSHPAYLSYYYSSRESVNPRMPPPFLSKEDWRVAQRFQGEGSSLFSMQPGISSQKAESDLMELRNGSGRNQTRGLDSSIGIGARRKSFADILQEGNDQPASSTHFLSRPSSRNNFNDEAELFAGNDLPGVQGHGSAYPYSLGSAACSSVSRSATPEPKLAGRGLPPVGSRVSQIEQKNVRAFNVQGGHSSGMNELSDITANLSGLSLSKQRSRDVDNHGRAQLNLDLDSGYDENRQFDFMDNSAAENIYAAANYTDMARMNGFVNNINASKLSSGMTSIFPRRTSSSANLYSQGGSSVFGGVEGHHQNASANFIPSSGGFSLNQIRNSSIDAHLDTVMTSLANEAGPDLHSPLSDPRYIQFLQRNPEYAARAANALDDLSLVKNRMSGSYGELDGIQKAYLENLLLAKQRDQLELSLLGQSSGLSHDNYAIGSYGLGSPYQGNILGNTVLPHPGSGSSMFPNDRISRINSMTRNSLRRSTSSTNIDIGNNLPGRVVSSLLDDFKNNKIKSYELPDIVDHVVEFSMDQYGSRFIQQKLEIATTEEKTIIFPEIVPHAHTLMTDVFGNYVIQKFFEHGTQSQRRDLANQLTGHVLPLSLQMYGCRVIQKALEVVDVDQQTQMVAELDGSIIKCVRDQNGNHVIQKCIECVPQDRIQFIISAFYGQVVVLSTHPYGCRVIQRVLEHCHDANTQQIIMDEIMQSVCTLAQDQYGNYVIQHVLQFGKPHERTAVIYKLAGQIVRMSQQKFASNVVEKCLTFGGPEERQILVNEMLGSTEENEPLQAMMKDPFGNYVVQKVLETCNDESLELLLSRIKVHLNTLKRYTYGKHIVSRIEKLVATGERRIGLSSTLSYEQSQFGTAR